jgi:hypothetical protein
MRYDPYDLMSLLIGTFKHFLDTFKRWKKSNTF